MQIILGFFVQVLKVFWFYFGTIEVDEISTLNIANIQKQHLFLERVHNALDYPQTILSTAVIEIIPFQRKLFTLWIIRSKGHTVRMREALPVRRSRKRSPASIMTAGPGRICERCVEKMCWSEILPHSGGGLGSLNDQPFVCLQLKHQLQETSGIADIYHTVGR